jgi:hypothetical protein
LARGSPAMMKRRESGETDNGYKSQPAKFAANI